MGAPEYSAKSSMVNNVERFEFWELYHRAMKCMYDRKKEGGSGEFWDQLRRDRMYYRRYLRSSCAAVGSSDTIKNQRPHCRGELCKRHCCSNPG